MKRGGPGVGCAERSWGETTPGPLYSVIADGHLPPRAIGGNRWQGQMVAGAVMARGGWSAGRRTD